MRELIGKGLLTAAAASSVFAMTGGYAQATDAAGTAAGSPGLLSGNSVQAPVEIPVNVCGNTVDPVGVLNPAFGNSCANVSGAQTSSGTQASSPGTHRPAQGAGPVAPRTEPAPSRPHHVDDNDHHPGNNHHGNGRDHDASSTHQGPREHAGSGPATDAPLQAGPADHGGSSASGAATNSPGLLSGNLLQAPLDIPLNVCGNSVDVVGLLNPAFGNGCANVSDDTPEAPVLPPAPVDPPETSTPPRTVEPPTVPGGHEPMLPERSPVEEGEVVEQLAETGTDANLLAAAAMSAGLLIGGGILYRRSHAAGRR
ncbi:chaplin [Streptomyces sp. NBC_01498]|uniref:chaplin n=1 Tax=Streptomyces sp. NBC_01498 TaxID=2975870 RepID=UPI002E7C07EF|nr:chaplin [Streptomyces sp. NBC_01498]